MNIIFRPYRKTETNDLCRLMGQLGYPHTEETLTGITLAIRNNGGEIFVAEYNNKVVGCACAIIDIRLASGISGEIVSVVVEEGMRGNGIGKALVEKAETWLFEKVGFIRIRANCQRSEAPKFYQGLGYSLSKTQSVFVKSAK